MLQCRFKGRVRRGILDESGASMVEAAVSFLFLITIMFGTLEMFLALSAYDYVSNAAREATRYAAVRGSSCTKLTNCGVTSTQIQIYVQNVPFPGINANNVSVATTWLSSSGSTPATWTACNNQCNTPGNAVQVVVSYPFPLSIPFVPKSTLSVSSTSQMVIAQ